MSRRIKVAQDMWQLMGVKREDKAERAKALMENFRFWGAPVASSLQSIVSGHNLGIFGVICDQWVRSSAVWTI